MRYTLLAPMTAVALTVVSTGALTAQRPDTVRAHPPGTGRGEQPAPAPFVGPGAPAMMLQHRTQLDLTDAQVQRLETIAATERREMQRLAPELMRAHADYVEATAGDMDLDRAHQAMRRMTELHTDMMMARLRARQQARQLLSPEQRTRFDAQAGPVGAHPIMGPMMRRHPGAQPGTRPGAAPAHPGGRHRHRR